MATAELGFAVAFGVLLDAFLVRTVLVPALVHDIGPLVWWPARLAADRRASAGAGAASEQSRERDVADRAG